MVLEPKTVYPATKLFSTWSESDSVPYLGDESNSSHQAQHSRSLSSPRLYSETEAVNTPVGVTLLFCPTEEEWPNFQQCGDFDVVQLRSRCLKEFLDSEQVNDSSTKFMNMTLLDLMPLTTEGYLLATLIEDASHQLASLNQVGDYPSISVSLPEHPAISEQAHSRRLSSESTSIPNMSSTILCEDQRARTSTTTGLKWPEHECGLDWERPGIMPANFQSPLVSQTQVPAASSQQLSLEDCTAAVPSDTLAADPNLGHTSTTHEIRWTQIEQETLTVDRTSGQWLPVPVCFNLVESNINEMWYKFRPTNNLTTITTTTPPFSRHGIVSNPKKYRTILSVRSEKLALQPDSCLTLPDHSFPIPSEDVANTTQTLNELTWLGDPSNLLTQNLSLPEPQSLSSMTSECDHDDDVTKLAVQQSLLLQPPNPPFVCSLNIADLGIPSRDTCSRCEAIALVRRLSEQKWTQTSPRQQPERNQTHLEHSNPSFLQTSGQQACPNMTYLLHSPPVGSEPPSIRIRPNVAFELHYPEPDHVDTGAEPQGDAAETTGMSVARLILKSTALPTTGKLAPLRLRQMPAKLSTRFEPFEKLRAAPFYTANKQTKGRKFDEFSQLDLNLLEEDRIDNVSEHTVDRDWANVFRCIYVEVSLRRNLDSVATPTNLSYPEMKMVYTMLDRKLKNAVATQFLPYTTRTRISDTCSTSSGPQIPLAEVGDVGIDVGSRFDNSECPDTFPGDQLLPNQRTRGLKSHTIRTGKLFKYVLHRTGTKRTSSALSSGANGAYVFAAGPRHVKPPKPWWDHLSNTVALTSDYRSMAAWEIQSLQLVVGGLINYGHHLQIIVSTKDGRLGIACNQASGLLTELVRKGTRYVTGSECGCPYDSIRLFFKSPGLARLLATNETDMSSAIGLNDLGLGVLTIRKHAAVNPPKSCDTIVLYTKGDCCLSDPNQIRRLITGTKRLRTLSVELTRSACNLKRTVMPVETMDYLFAKIRKNVSKIFLTANQFLAQTSGCDLQNVITQYHGTLAHCIRGNAYCPDELYPRASDPDAYMVFHRLFDPILTNFGLFLSATGQPPSQFKLPDDLRLKSRIPYVIRYRVRFVRNLSGFGFPSVMSKRDFEAVERILREALMSWKDEGTGSWYKLADLKEQHPVVFNSLLRKHLLMPTQTAIRKATGVYRFWPQGRSVYVAPNVNRNCDLVAQINAEDHLRVICIDWAAKRPYLAYSRATKLMAWLDKQLSFSKSLKWGFLSPVPTNVGTGMLLSSWLKTANIQNSASVIERVCERYRLRACAVNPPDTPAIYHLFDVAPVTTLDRTEAESVVSFIQSLHKVCTLYGKYLRG
ncbi:hypothetical protein EG68_05730 [Paragonimus skrjabini miyazakii]|uniref:Uncharacterized protein n=1 Tax=Paragonimus skrjabini miyazakii TaxID=59628 RepID=A0A8S9YWM9_9TREM|nr:hypothetical protein EG68_05730 [Paragonimus skrjabini miyazakii]